MKPDERQPGVLYVVSTPIGNLEDITLRALRVLREVDLIAAEDTRRTRQLLTHYGIRKPLISYHDFNRRMREKTLLQELREGKSIALVTDAGTPGISDPGEELVLGAVQESIPLVPIPGPAALISALSVSGLPTESFLFYGFLPSRAAARKKWLASLKDRPETLVFYESPRRVGSLLQDAAQILGDRRVVVAREMTKVYEEVYRGSVSEVLERLDEEEVKGEVTIILEGCPLPPKAEASSIVEALKYYSRDRGLSMRESVHRVAEDLKVSRRQVYQESLKVKKEFEE
jgi:16S rRNA (cytidine1402-2'-O)-methyltransferase